MEDRAESDCQLPSPHRSGKGAIGTLNGAPFALETLLPPQFPCQSSGEDYRGHLGAAVVESFLGDRNDCSQPFAIAYWVGKRRDMKRRFCSRGIRMVGDSKVPLGPRVNGRIQTTSLEITLDLDDLR